MLLPDFQEIPAEGLALEGEITDDIFRLNPEERVTPAGPISYQARAYVIDGDLVVEGNFACEFELECARCLEKFLFPVKLVAHNLTENLENPTEADLTEALREDILLALPVYPHCEEGKIPRQCPAKGKFDPSQQSPTETEAGESGEEAPNPWAALDDMDGLDKHSD
ncbi:MAG: YceD family protein [Verrucomicrobiales bacterium]